MAGSVRILGTHGQIGVDGAMTADRWNGIERVLVPAPGLITMNLPRLLDDLDRAGVGASSRAHIASTVRLVDEHWPEG